MKTFMINLKLDLTEAKAFELAKESGGRVLASYVTRPIEVPAIRGFFSDSCPGSGCMYTDDPHYHFRLKKNIMENYWVEAGIDPDAVTFDDIFRTIEIQYSPELFSACAEYALMRG